jgi:3-dehydroquinate synthase
LDPIRPQTDHEGSVRVELGSRSYTVRIVSDRIDEFAAFARTALEATWAGRGCRRALIVADENLSGFTPDLIKALDGVGIAANLAILPAGEETKSLDCAADLYDHLVKMKADRHVAIVALGGGVIGDLAGFVAATYARGLPLVMVPTSLLAQVDSSVGGKVGVNHPRAKNIIGAFHQPVGVWIDTAVLKSLPMRELRCGLAEVIKYGVILDAAFFSALEADVEPILDLAPASLRYVVTRSCELKARVVSQDEREETGLRALLNFGHTVAHAVEAVAGYDGDYRHGEAVAIGMVAECRLAERLRWVPPALTERLVQLLVAFGLPIAADELDVDALLEAMTRDKKNRGGRVRFVLPRDLGRVELTDAPTVDDVRAVLTGRA